MGGSKELEEGAGLKLDFTKLDKVASKHCDVVPVVVQDSRTDEVLIVAYVNEVALAETFSRRVACLWSTSRNELWVKGATSGDTLDLDDVLLFIDHRRRFFLPTGRRVPRRQGGIQVDLVHQALGGLRNISHGSNRVVTTSVFPGNGPACISTGPQKPSPIT